MSIPRLFTSSRRFGTQYSARELFKRSKRALEFVAPLAYATGRLVDEFPGAVERFAPPPAPVEGEGEVHCMKGRGKVSKGKRKADDRG